MKIFRLFRDKTRQRNDVMGITATRNDLGMESSYTSLYHNDSENLHVVYVSRIDYDFIKTVGLKIIEGRNFSKESSSDTKLAIVNEALVRRLKLDDPIGKIIGNQNKGGIQGMKIIGVVKDFHFQSLRKEIGPACKSSPALF